MADVVPFLENVLRGTNLPRERMLEMAAHYEQIDGVSPINARNRALVAALRAELARHGPALPVYWGNRNWHPLLEDTPGRMAVAGELGLNMVRAATVGTHPRFVAMVRELILERLDDRAARPALGRPGPAPDACPPDLPPPASEGARNRLESSRRPLRLPDRSSRRNRARARPLLCQRRPPH